MKLANFRAHDRPGGGLSHGNRLEAIVWEAFRDDVDVLVEEAARIKSAIAQGIKSPTKRNGGQPIISFLQPFKPKADIAYIRTVAGGTKSVDRDHETLVNDFALWLSDRGLQPGRNVAIDIGLIQPSVVIEAKYVRSWPAAIREATGQLYEYRYFNIASPDARLVFLASRPVPDEWIGYLERDRNIAVVWRGDDGFVLTNAARLALGLADAQ